MGTTTAIASPVLPSIMLAQLQRWLTHSTVFLADFLALSTAGALAVVTRYLFHAQFTPGEYMSFAPAILIFFAVFAFSGLYPGIACSPTEEFRKILRASTIGFLLLIGTTFFLREGLLASRIVFGLAWVLTIVLVPVSRRLLRGVCARQPWWGIPTVILGEEEASVMMLDLLQGHRRLGLRPVALLIDGGLNKDALPDAGDVFTGGLSHARSIARRNPGCYAVIAMPTSGSDRIRAVLSEHTHRFGNVLMIPDMFGMRSLSVSATDICGVLTLKLDQKLTHFFPQFCKRSFDLAVAAFAGLLVSPVLLALCAAVRLTSKGPIFYGQGRIGKDRQTFKVWKFRSMVVDADAVLASHLEADPELLAEWRRDHKLKRDPRVTAIGRILRKTSLDELPQLWNVLCGDMSLVGPRPIVESEVEKYGESFVQYLRVRPGVTGLWQVSGRNNTTYELRTRMDDYYVRNWSLSLDTYLLLRTLKTLLLSEGAY